MERKAWPCLECRVMMQMVNDDFCKCPICGTEVWFNFDAPATPTKKPNTYVSRSLPEGYKVPPGGSKSSGKRSKPDPLKALRTERYKLV